MTINFFNPTKMITGENCVLNNIDELKKLGESCLIVTGGSSAKKSGALNDALKALALAGITHLVYDGVEPNPTIRSCMEAGRIARENGAEFILGIGGGSPLDAAKAAAVYAANDMADGMDIYNANWKTQALPIAEIGTTAGTGSEVTSFAILTKPDGRKKSFGRFDTYPTLAFGDARYTMTLPLEFTLSTALDALAHALEAYFNTAANDLTDLFIFESAAILREELEALKDCKDISEISLKQRGRLYHASILAGYPLSQCGTLYCHTLSYYLTENYGVPHGFACAAFLPDLIKRGKKYAPERAKKLFKETDASGKELRALIKSTTRLPEVKLSKDVIKRLSAEGAETKNFIKTIPNGFSAEDSVQLLTELFGG